MPRGRKPKEIEKTDEVNPENIERGYLDSGAVQEKESVQNAKKEEKEAQKETPKVEELPHLEASQQYFEAPDGTIMVGEKSAKRLWYRRGNDGGGMYIKPRRVRREL